MKKLFIYALLAMTGFAFYSCDDRFDNPVTQQQDPTNPYSTWTYEVKIDFAYTGMSYWDEEAEEYVYYEEPTTVWVYNQKFEKLGFLTANDEDNPEKYTGVLKGAIGDTLIISSIEDFDYMSKQDGTIKTLVDNKLILQTAKVPIIIANETTGKIGTQNVQLEIETKVCGFNFGDWRYTNSVKITSDNLYCGLTGENSFTVNIAKDAVDAYRKYIALAFNEKEKADYFFELENGEAGFNAEAIAKEAFWAEYGRDYTSNFTPQNYPSSIDLTKYFAFRKSLIEEPGDNWSLYINASNPSEVNLTQSGKDALPINISINSPKATLKDINIRYMNAYGNYYSDPEEGTDFSPVITLEGDNIIGSKDNMEWQPFGVGSLVTFKGTGSLTLDGNSYGIYCWGNTYSVYDKEKEQWIPKPCGIVIEESAKIVAKKTVNFGYTNYNDEMLQNYITVNGGSLEAIGTSEEYNKMPAIYLWGGKLNIGEGGTVKATTGQEGDNPNYIFRAAYADNTWTYAEAELADLVKDASKFSDTIDNTTATRIIKKK